MRKVKLNYQHVMSIITHYYSNLKSSRDIKNAFMSFPESGYIRCHVSSSIRLFVEYGMADPEPSCLDCMCELLYRKNKYPNSTYTCMIWVG